MKTSMSIYKKKKNKKEYCFLCADSFSTYFVLKKNAASNFDWLLNMSSLERICTMFLWVFFFLVVFIYCNAHKGKPHELSLSKRAPLLGCTAARFAAAGVIHTVHC